MDRRADPTVTTPERDGAAVEAVDFIRRLMSAWECCATCAGGVLGQRDRARQAAAKAEAWDEGCLAESGHDHQWTRCAACPHAEDQPCACSGERCTTCPANPYCELADREAT